MSNSSVFVVSEHDQKYDRQTRIWGGHGQEAIEKAHVCCLGAGPVCSETLKNLVLPNVGRFTLVDDQKVTMTDVGDNFFVTSDDLGKPRGEVVKDLLLEMNGDVKGFVATKNPTAVIKDEIDFFSSFDLVIASDVTDSDLSLLDTYLRAKNIPLIVVNSNGYVGTVRLSIPEVLIVETHYDNDRYDLYVHPEQLAHFPALQQYVDSFPSFADMEDADHSHIPYIVILVRLLTQWRAENGDKIPSSYDEGRSFKDLIRKSARSFGKEGNFQEAEQFAYRVYRKPQLDFDVQGVLDSKECDSITATSHNFWVMARAVKEFMAKEGHGFPPVSANIPDMTSQTKPYTRLQKIFQDRASEDAVAVNKHVKSLLEAVGRSADAIPEAEVDYFVKNFRGIKAMKIRSIAEELEAKTFNSDEVNEVLQEWEEPPADPDEFRPKDIHWYLAVRVANAFKEKHGRYPGSTDVDAAKDLEQALQLAETMSKDLGLSSPIQKECVEEIVRYGGTTIHTTAAFLGGVASQVALKIILRQFVPLNNTMVYNGIHGKQTAYEL